MKDEINAQCAECGKVYQYVPKEGFPRKYCFECSAEKKASFGMKDEAMKHAKKVDNEVYKTLTAKEEFPASKEEELMNIPVVKITDPKEAGEMYKRSLPKQHTTMYVSYAKDIFCAMINNEKTGNMILTDFEVRMGEAIELVKQAQKAFS